VHKLPSHINLRQNTAPRHMLHQRPSQRIRGMVLRRQPLTDMPPFLRLKQRQVTSHTPTTSNQRPLRRMRIMGLQPTQPRLQRYQCSPQSPYPLLFPYRSLPSAPKCRTPTILPSLRLNRVARRGPLLLNNHMDPMAASEVIKLNLRIQMYPLPFPLL